MTTMEDRARAAMQAIASTVDDAPPLRLSPAPDPVPSKRRRVPLSLWKRRGFLVPAAAALAVLAVATTLVLVRTVSRDQGSSIPTSLIPWSASGRAADAVPPYYLVIGSPTVRGTDFDPPVSVEQTRTGRVLESIPAPRGTVFFGVAAAANDRTFVVAAKQGDNSPSGQYLGQSWYLLRITSDGRLAAPAMPLTRLPIPPTTAQTSVEGMALSADGTRLAVAIQPNAAANPDSPAVLRIYSVATGEVLHTWTARDGLRAFTGRTLGDDPSNVLSWVDGDRELAFTSWWRTSAPNRRDAPVDHMTVRLLKVAGTGTDLIADSRLVWSTDSAPGAPGTLKCPANFVDALVTGDGTAVVCGAMSTTGLSNAAGWQTWTVAWLEYSTATGKLERTLTAGTARGKAMDLIEDPPRVFLEWVDATGETLIGYWPVGATQSATTWNFPIEEYAAFSPGGHTRLPSPLNGSLLDGIAW